MLTDREIELPEALHHMMAANLEPPHKAYHIEWADYHIRRATQGMDERPAVALRERFNQWEARQIQG